MRLRCRNCADLFRPTRRRPRTRTSPTGNDSRSGCEELTLQMRGAFHEDPCSALVWCAGWFRCRHCSPSPSWTPLSRPRTPPGTCWSAKPDVVVLADMRFGMFLCWGPVTLTGQEIGWSRAPRRAGTDSCCGKGKALRRATSTTTCTSTGSPTSSTLGNGSASPRRPARST